MKWLVIVAVLVAMAPAFASEFDTPQMLTWSDIGAASESPSDFGLKYEDNANTKNTPIPEPAGAALFAAALAGLIVRRRT